MPPARDLPDKAIRGRGALLYGDEPVPSEAEAAVAIGSRKTVAEYLRDTPPAPLSGGVKAALGAAVVVVALVFLLTLVKSLGPKRGPASPAPTSAIVATPSPRT
jgi:hypothetical protein